MDSMIRLLLCVLFPSFRLGGGGGGDGGVASAQAEEQRKSGLRGRIEQMYQPNDTFAAEENDLRQALTGQYTDELGDLYKKNERTMRFGAANTGNIGGSSFAEGSADLSKQNELGATKIGEAVQRAINNLRASREESKLRGLQLVNAGGGEEAVSAAASGLRSSIDNAKAGSRERLFDDLFRNVAFTKAAGDASSRDDAATAYFNQLRGGSGLRTPASDSKARIIA